MRIEMRQRAIETIQPRAGGCEPALRCAGDAPHELFDTRMSSVDVRQRAAAALHQTAYLPLPALDVARGSAEEAAVQLCQQRLLRLQTSAGMHEPTAQVIDVLHARLDMPCRAA